jgi:hypothetical protein
MDPESPSIFPNHFVMPCQPTRIVELLEVPYDRDEIMDGVGVIKMITHQL